MAPNSEKNVQRYLEGAMYPASKGDLASVAKKNDAPQGFVENLQGLKETSFSEQSQVPGEFSNPEEVIDALKHSGPSEDVGT